MPIKNQLLFYFLSVLIYVVSMHYHIIFLILYVPLYYFLYTKIRFVQCIIIIIFTAMFVTMMQYPTPNNETSISGKVGEVRDDSLTVYTNNSYTKVYGDFSKVKQGDNIELEITHFDILSSKNDHAFDYQKYLLSKGIMQVGYLNKINHHQPVYSLYSFINERIQGHDKITSYAKLFLFGVQDSQVEELYTSMQSLSLVHLFALSGMHMFFLKRWLQSILQYLISPKYLEIVIFLLIGIYIISIPYSISFTRAYLMMVFYYFGKRWFSTFDIFGFTGLLFIFFNPYIIYSLSFIFSFFMYFLILCIHNHKYMGILLYLGALPIVLSLNYQIPLLSLALSFICLPIIELLYQLLLWFLIFGEFIEIVLLVVIYVFEMILSFSEAINIMIPFKVPSLFFIGLYYWIYFNMIFDANIGVSLKKSGIKILCIIVVFFGVSKFQLFTKVVMIDVGQGDSFLIQQAISKGDILIDTGGSLDYDIASNTLIPYLKSQGITKLEYLFLSHDDFDHSGAAKSLQEQFPIEHIIVSDKQKEYIIGDIKINLLEFDKVSDDSNDLSLVMHVIINDVEYLFTGDASVEIEKQIIENYPELDIDVLKVGHHGSNTSTNSLLLEKVSPSVALISAGYQNEYGHPTNLVIDRLKSYGVKIYRSDLDGMVKIIHYPFGTYVYK